MNEGNLFLQLIAKINRALSKTRIQQDITQLEKTPFYLRLTAALNKNKSRARVSQDLKDIGNNQTINVRARVDRNSAVNSLNEVRQSLQQNAQGNPVTINAEINAPADSLETVDEAQEDIIRGSDGIRGVVQSYVNWQRALELVVQAAKKAIDTVKTLAKAQTDLQIVTGKSNIEMQSMMRGYNKLAQDLSATTIDVSGAADEWLRAGYSVSETQELIADSTILAKIGQIETADATKYLTSAMNGFKVEAGDVIGIIDRLSAVDTSAAVSSSGLAEAMSKCANSADVAGVSMDSLIGYIATVSEVTQKSNSVVGESFKTLLARMGKVKLGDFIDDDGTDISGEINDVEKTLAKFGIKLRDSASEFRDFEDVIYDVGMAWDNFTSVEQNAIANAFGGVYQRENVITLFQNFDRALELTEISANSSGTALERYAIYESNLEAATNRLTAAFESLAYNTIDAEFLEALTGGTARIVELIDKSKVLDVSLTALSFTAVIKGLLLLSTKLIVTKNNINAMTTAMNLATMTTQRNAEQNTLLGNSFSQLTSSQQRLILSNKKLNTEQRIAILMSTGMTREMAEARLQALGLATAEGAAASATFSLRGAWEALKLSIASNPLGLLIITLTTTSMLIQHNIEKQKELRQEIKENAEQARETSEEIFDLYNQYNDLSEAVLTDASHKEQLTSVTDALIEKLGYEKSALQELTEEYGDLDTAIKSVTLESLKTEWDKLLLEYGEVEGELAKLVPAKALANGTRNINVKNDKGLNDYDDTIKLLEDSGIFDKIVKPSAGAGYSNPNITFTLIEGYDGAEGAKALYETVTKAIQLLNSEYSSEVLLDNAVYKEFVNLQDTLSDKITEFDTAVSSTNANLAQQEIILSLMNKEVPVTTKEFKDYKGALIESALENEKFVGTEEDIRKAIESSLALMPEFAHFFEIMALDIDKKSIPSVEELTGAYSKLNSKLKDTIELQEKLADAFQKVANGEKFSASEVYDLISEIPELAKYLESLDGGFTFSAEGIDLINDNLIADEKADIQAEMDKAQQIIDNYNDIKERMENAGSLSYKYALQFELNGLEGEKAGAEEIIKAYQMLSNILDGMFDEHTMTLEGIDSNYESAKSFIEGYNKSIETVDSAIKKMNNSQALTYDEMTALLEISPELSDSIEERSDGYYIEIESLKDLRFESREARDQFIQDEIDKANVAIKSAEAIIAAHMAINSATDWQNNWATISEQREIIKQYLEDIAKLEKAMGDVYDTDTSSTNSGKDEIVTAFEKELKYLDYLRDMGMISAKEYYKQLYFLNEKYYSDNADYLEQYRDNEVKIRDGITDIEIRAIDRQIEALELLKEKREEEKELQELQVELEEKKLELLNKQSQKNVRYYDAEKREWIWTHNREDVADAQKAVDEAQEALDEHLYQSNEDKKIEQLEQIKEILQGDEDNPNNATQFVGSEGVTTKAKGRIITAEEFYKYIGISQPIDATALVKSIYANGVQPNVEKITESMHTQNYQTVNRNVQGNNFNVTINGSNLSADELEKVTANAFNKMMGDFINQAWLKSR